METVSLEMFHGIVAERLLSDAREKNSELQSECILRQAYQNG
jgi:hypothetical protein